MVGILSFPFGKPYVQVRPVSFRECSLNSKKGVFTSHKERNFVPEFAAMLVVQVLGDRVLFVQVFWGAV